MIYDEVRVLAHPRSGSHYLAKLVAINFFDTEDYVKCCYGGHVCSEELALNKNRAILYIYRKEKDVLR